MLRTNIFKLLLSITIVTAFVSGSVGLAQNQGEDQTHFSPEKHQVVDVGPLLKGKQLKRGLNPIFTTPKGQNISAKVKNGKIVDWVVTDKDGRPIRTTVYELVARQSGAARAKVVRCWRCYKNSDGSIDCFEIDPCPFTTPS